MPEKIAFEREPAKRVFSEEFRATQFSRKFSDDQKAPTFAILPTGAVANRLLVIGVLVRKEKVEAKNNTTIYRAEINDNIGRFFVAATSFQQEAMIELAKITPPEIVAITGKANIRPVDRPDGNKVVYAGLRVEDVVIVDRSTKDEWIIDTAEATLKRIATMEAGTDPWYNEVKAMYGTDTKVYRGMVSRALDALLQANL